ncbi:NADH-quinone oxidoreductase subunit C [Streptomyces sp. NBC_00286]|uniref:NADH-quinone oxidoreductase subunit C n=1 Tax=Streptomyces sp. NBC_00286 TaxID=2975701 RepID=UPI002E27D8EB|nr:NADH-quinone oxidoreductase subunit C [Streptomyces sp. NBC_00286]
MTGWLPSPVEELFGTEATAEESYELLTVDVPPAAWISALETARDELGCTYFDWLSAVDEPGTGFRVAAHVVALAPVRRLLVRTTVPHDAPVLPSAVDVYAGAAWHERETHEMFGVTFEGHPGLAPLLLPEGFEGHPLRKDFVLAARVAKAWPGAKEPGESEHGGPKRRQMLPPGVPDPNEWGPLKGQLPPAPARPARGAARAAGERPARRTRTAGEGSASQAPASGAPAAGPGTGTTAEGRPAGRRARSVSEGSATQRTEGAERAEGTEAGSAGAPSASPASASGAETPPAAPRRARSADEGSASQRGVSAAAPADEAGGEQQPGGKRQPEGGQPARPARARSTDAPWHHARPAFDDSEQKPPTGAPTEESRIGEPPTGESPKSESPTGESPTEERPSPERQPDVEPDEPRAAEAPEEAQAKPSETPEAQHPTDDNPPGGPQ